jgi:hypothetical protein
MSKTIGAIAIALTVAAAVPSFAAQDGALTGVSDLEWSKATGYNTIKGSALLRTRGGEVRTCAGLEVRLLPAGQSTDEFITDNYPSSAGGLDPVTSWRSRPFEPYVQTALCGALGEFEFSGLPDGKYYVLAVVTWEVPSLDRRRGLVSEGGTVAAAVSVAGGRTKNVVVTQ